MAVIEPQTHPEFTKQIIRDSDTAREMQRASVEARHNKKLDAIEGAFKQGKDIEWSKGYQEAEMVLVRIIFDEPRVEEINGKDHTFMGSKNVDKIRAFGMLSDKLNELFPANSPQTRVGTMNVYQQDPALAQRMLDAECKECGEVMTPGVAHECEVIDG